MKIRYCNRSSYPECDNAASECARAILGRKPPQLRDGSDRDDHSEYASEDGPSEEPRLPERLAEDRSNDSAKTCQRPSGDEDRYRLQGNRVALGARVLPNGVRLKLRHGKKNSFHNLRASPASSAG